MRTTWIYALCATVAFLPSESDAQMSFRQSFKPSFAINENIGNSANKPAPRQQAVIFSKDLLPIDFFPIKPEERIYAEALGAIGGIASNIDFYTLTVQKENSFTRTTETRSQVINKFSTTLIEPPMFTYGNYLNGVAASVIANCPPGSSAACVTGVMGGLEDGAHAISAYPSLDSVAFFVSNSNPPPIATTGRGTTYDATHMYPSPALTPAQVTKLKVGMFVQTLHPTPYKGRIISWSADGRSVTMQEWSVYGNAASGQSPPDGTGALVSAITKIWGQNTAILIGNSGVARDSVGYELDVACNLTGGCGATVDGSTGRGTGFEVVQVGSAGAADAYVARGTFNHGFDSWTGLICAFCADPTLQKFPNPSDGAFTTYQTGGTGFNFRPGHANSVFSVDYNGLVKAKNLQIDGEAVSILSPDSSSYLNFGQIASGRASISARIGSAILGWTQIWQGASAGLLASFIPPAGTAVNSLGVAAGSAGAPTTILNIGDASALGVGNPLRLKQYTVSTLPACSATTADTLVAATDLKVLVFGGAPKGGGLKHAPLFCDGSSWTMH